jgi:uncharacterized membrane protein YfcA
LPFEIKLVLVFLSGILAGFINIVAGGGSLFTLPALLFLGLPSAVANGTNRLAILIQTMVGIARFKKKGYFDYKAGLKAGIPAVIGSIIGSQLAIHIPDRLFYILLACVIFVVLVLLLLNPVKSRNEENPHYFHSRHPLLLFLVFLAIGFYGGVIQVGVGIILMAAFSLLARSSLIWINSVKTIVVGLYLSVSLGIFIYHGKVDWLYGFLLAGGNAIGAWAGTHFSVTRGDKWIKAVVFFSVCAILFSLLSRI